MENFDQLVSQLLADYATNKIGKEEIEAAIEKLEAESKRTRREMSTYDESLQRYMLPQLGEIGRLRMKLQTAIGVI